jgi:hypothetical protein
MEPHSGGDDRMTDEPISGDEVTAIRQRYEVQPRDWLELEPAYASAGVARFATNPGTISGPTTVRYSEDGSLAEFSMAVEHLEAETPTDGSDFILRFRQRASDTGFTWIVRLRSEVERVRLG